MADDISSFLSSYGMMTAERILMRYSLSLAPKDIMIALKNDHSFYNQLLKVPFKHVLNGIIIQQAYDYYVFAQKLFIDYLLSGESGKEGESPGGSTRDNLEEARHELMELGERYQDIVNEQDKTIANSQIYLIQYAGAFRAAKTQGMQNTMQLASFDDLQILESAFTNTLIYNDYKQFIVHFAEALGYGSNAQFKQKLGVAWEAMLDQLALLGTQLDAYIQAGQGMTKKATALRKRFYEFILRVRPMIVQLPDYSHNVEQEQKNKEALYFDPSIGDWE